MLRYARSCYVVAFFMLVVTCSPLVLAQPYNFVEIARGDGTGGSPFQHFQYGQGIDSAGQAVFRGTLDNGAGTGLFTGSGGATTTVVMETDYNVTWLASPSVANDGTVLFRAGPDTTRATMYGGSGGSHITYAAYSQTGPNWFGGVINLDSLALITGGVTSGTELHLSSGSSGPSLLYDATNYQDIGNFFSTDINEVGYIATVTGPATGLPWELHMGNGGPLIKLVERGQGFYGKLANVSINNQNHVGFGANVDSWGPKKLYLSQGGVPALVADLTGPYSQFDNFGMSINDLDEVAFWAELDDGGEGIYLGPDPTTDALIEGGDPLLGSTVTGLHFERFCMNHAGQVLFRATLANGDQVMVRADPLPTTPVTADSLEVILGNHLSGQLSDVDSSDDTYLKYSRGAAFSPTLPSIWLEFTGTLPTDTPNLLQVKLEANTNSNGIIQGIEMFNYITGQFESVDSRGATRNVDSVAEVTLQGDLTQYVEPGTGQVRTKVTYRDDGTAIFLNWRACIDQFIWRFN